MINKLVLMFAVVLSLSGCMVAWADEPSYPPPPQQYSYGSVEYCDADGNCRVVDNAYYYYVDGSAFYWDGTFGCWIGPRGFYSGNRWYYGTYPRGYYGHYNYYHGSHYSHGGYGGHGSYHGGGHSGGHGGGHR